jgi:hypothetical protein
MRWNVHLTGVHGSQHAGNKLIDTIALLHKGHECRDSAFIVRAASEVGEDKLLEGVDLVLKGHEVGNGLVPLVGVVDGLQTDVFLVFKGSCLSSAHWPKIASDRHTIEFWVLSVESELGQEIVDVL